MKTFPIVITSIYPDSPAMKEYIKKGYTIILIGDIKTPQVKKTAHLAYFSVADQTKLYKKFTDTLPVGHYARKNIGYLLAMSMSDGILETDDDNFPNEYYPNFKIKPIKAPVISSPNRFFNTYSFFATKNTNAIWPRGFPLSLIAQQSKAKNRQALTALFPIQQSLIDADSDFDAIYRLTNNQPLFFKKNKYIALHPHTYAPINTQNTFWSKEAFLFMYIPCFVSSRVCDIYRGYIAQRLIWEVNKMVLFLSPCVYQKRNPHNYKQDFIEELPLYTAIETFIDVLETVMLTGSIENKMIQIYKALIAAGLLKKIELAQVTQWITLVNNIMANRTTRPALSTIDTK